MILIGYSLTHAQHLRPFPIRQVKQKGNMTTILLLKNTSPQISLKNFRFCAHTQANDSHQGRRIAKDALQNLEYASYFRSMVNHFFNTDDLHYCYYYDKTHTNVTVAIGISSKDSHAHDDETPTQLTDTDESSLN